MSEMREFETGATRSADEGKIDYEGILAPSVLRRYGEYMMKHAKQEDGKMRPSDNWQKGIPRDAYMKSMFRHFVEVWTLHRAQKSAEISKEAFEDSLCALMFNVMGYLFEMLKLAIEKDKTEIFYDLERGICIKTKRSAGKGV